MSVPWSVLSKENFEEIKKKNGEEINLFFENSCFSNVFEKSSKIPSV